MSSPVNIPFKSVIRIDKSLDRPVYLQIAHQMINAIQRGVLLDGIQLPGTRSLADDLEVHRKTIIAAYYELDAQGWTEIRPNKGTFVRNKVPLPAIQPKSYRRKTAEGGPDDHEKFLNSYPSKTGYTFKQSILLDVLPVTATSGLEFNDGLPDIRLLPLERLSKVYGGILKSKTNYRHFGYSHVEGNEFFRETLASYLNNTRGLHINKNNILTTRGIHMSIYMASSILIEPGDLVIVGDLSYYLANMCFQQCGGKIISVPVDEEGISVEAIRELCKKKSIRMLYLTPHHHYPTTVTLSAERRTELLQLAATYGFIILEDDYDYDFHYNGNSVLPLASADTNGMVVYIGSFCKSLAPGFRSGYLVAPENLIVEMAKLRRLVDRQGDMLMEQALAELLEEREIQRHLKKALKIYQERRDVFTGLLQKQLGEELNFVSPPGGLSVWTQWNPRLNLMRISKKCQKRNLYLPQELLYQNESFTAMRLGFGNLTTAELEEAVHVLSLAVKDS
ncbi:PLP-dependent aminotransferase family protein [Pedobacter sp. MC2016-15]|uniref:aminotransferase-like domain-containing protein n=1 Tax=Pedobacter sp. MC2016-15 TaxID=2994473 RepID=UPI002246DEC2|nr:PLP-dependent aminotransferase family protein [Pedobacter sp. MC2016-15]MCX2477610.1 PLP-dependent aminotransferase family protein [Pedobacter sp. MC2016-15]